MRLVRSIRRSRNRNALAKIKKNTMKFKLFEEFINEASKYELKVLKSSLNDALALLRKEDFNFKQINGKPADNFVIVKFTSADELQAAKEVLDTQNNRKSYLAESAVKEAKFKPMGLSKDETLKVAKTYAEAISKLDGIKCTVNMKSLEEDSFDLDLPGDEYAGGSYSIDSEGNVYNDGMGVGMKTPPIYGKYNDSVSTIIKNIEKIK